jgi:Mrp family chromosome partitioning ATPase
VERDVLLDRREDLIGLRNSLTFDSQFAGSSAVILSAAVLGESVGAGLIQFTAIALVLGILFGLGLTFVLPGSEPGFRGPEEVAETMDASLLADIADFSAEARSIVVTEAPVSPAAIEYKRAATALLSRLDLMRRGLSEIQPELERDEKGRFKRRSPADAGEPGRIVAVISPGPREGRTSVTLNLAAAAALQSDRVLAVDADFGNPRLTELLTGSPTAGRGLTDIVHRDAGPEDVAQRVDLDDGSRLSLLGRGSMLSAPLDFFRSPGAQQALRKAAAEYDLLLLDTPPLYVDAYASTLARYADEVIVVVPHGSEIDDMRDFAARLRVLSISVQGFIYNRVPNLDTVSA